MNIKKEIGEKIKRFRKKSKFTQEKLAEMVDISSRNLSNIELGISYPKPETLEKIMIALNMTTEEMFSNDNLKTDNELLRDINTFISEVKTDRFKLEKIYKILKTFIE